MPTVLLGKQNVMDTTVYVSLSHQIALRRQLDLIAGNIANAETSGYRRENAVFQSYLERQPLAGTKAARNVNYVLDYGVARDSSPGDMSQTNNPLDVALTGEGFFTVALGNDAIAYTRNGHFSLSEDGYLTTANGARLLDRNGNPFRFDSDEKNIQISPDGSVSSSAGEKGQLALARFASDTGLTRLGDTLYQGANAEPVAPENVKLRSGFLEKSNVKPIVETTEMIDVLRTYQSTTRLLDRYEDMRKRGIERLGKIN
jgi:flagellar basal-body rod protein FlgF